VRLSRSRVAGLILAFVLVVPATAVAVSPFVDVAPGKFYEAPINWAFSNDITTGKDTTHFAPDLGVTRGESVTFLKRYHDNIVQPGIDSANARIDSTNADLASTNAAITGLGQTVGGLPCTTDQFARFNGTNWVCGSIRPVSRLEPLAAATVDSITGSVGRHASIAIGADNLPIISHYDFTNTSLKVSHCTDPSCSSATSSTVDTGGVGVAGWDTSIAIGADNLPIISYGDRTATSLKVAHCNNATCTSSTTATVDTGGTNDVGGFTSIAIGTDNLPIISYGGGVSSGVKVARCTDVTCTSASIVSVESGGNWATSIAIDAGGYPVVAYDSGPNSGTSLHVTRIDVSVIGIAFG